MLSWLAVARRAADPDRRLGRLPHRSRSFGAAPGVPGRLAGRARADACGGRSGRTGWRGPARRTSSWSSPSVVPTFLMALHLAGGRRRRARAPLLVPLLAAVPAAGAGLLAIELHRRTLDAAARRRQRHRRRLRGPGRPLGATARRRSSARLTPRRRPDGTGTTELAPAGRAEPLDRTAHASTGAREEAPMTTPQDVPFVNLGPMKDEIARRGRGGLPQGHRRPPRSSVDRTWRGVRARLRRLLGSRPLRRRGQRHRRSRARAAGLRRRPGDEVVIPANTFVATAEAVVRDGARCRCSSADVDEHYLIDPAAVRERTGHTAAIVPVHLYGQMAAGGGAGRARPGRGVAIVEDAAQSQGARRHGRRLGIARDRRRRRSFYPGKNLGAYGDAGAVTTELGRRRDEAARARQPRRRAQVRARGGRARTPASTPCRPSCSTPSWPGWTRGTTRGARPPTATHACSATCPACGCRPSLPGNEPVWHLYVVEVEDRDKLKDAFDEAGVGRGRPLSVADPPAPGVLLPRASAGATSRWPRRRAGGSFPCRCSRG